jgi:hypothetical protein
LWVNYELLSTSYIFCLGLWSILSYEKKVDTVMIMAYINIMNNPFSSIFVLLLFILRYMDFMKTNHLYSQDNGRKKHDCVSMNFKKLTRIMFNYFTFTKKEAEMLFTRPGCQMLSKLIIFTYFLSTLWVNYELLSTSYIFCLGLWSILSYEKKVDTVMIMAILCNLFVIRWAILLI